MNHPQSHRTMGSKKRACSATEREESFVTRQAVIDDEAEARVTFGLTLNRMPWIWESDFISSPWFPRFLVES